MNQIDKIILSKIGKKTSTTKEIIFDIKKINPNINEKTIRVRICRLIKNGKIHTSKPIVFKNNEYLLSCGKMNTYSKYLTECYKRVFWLNDLKNILIDQHKKITMFDFNKINGSTTKQENRKCLEILKCLFPKIMLKNGYIFCHDENSFHENREISFDNSKERIIKMILYTHQRQNIIFGKNIRYRSTKYTECYKNGIPFDAYAEQSIFQENGNSKSIVVYDIAIDKNYGKKELQAYKKRIDKLKALTKQKIIPFAIYYGDDNTDVCNHLGIGKLNIRDLFGKKINLMFEKINVLETTKEYKIEALNEVLSYLYNLEQYEAIKGGLFEHFCKQILIRNMRDKENTKITCNIKNKEENKITSQVDILVEYQNEKLYCECKCFGPKLSCPNDIIDVLNQTKPKDTTDHGFKHFYNKFLGIKDDNYNNTFLIFSSSGFSDKYFTDEINKKIIKYKTKIPGMENFNQFSYKENLTMLSEEEKEIWKKYFLKEN